MDFRELSNREQGWGPAGGPGTGIAEKLDRIARVPLGRAWALVEPLVDALRSGLPSTIVSAAGGVRRFEPLVDDLRIIIETDRRDAVADILRAAANTHRLEDVVIQVVPPGSGAVALLRATGSAEHLRQLEVRAADRGLRVTGRSEEEIYRVLGLPFIAPELREGADEIEAAESGHLPPLMTSADLRGDFHSHTTWSDGQDSIEVMVRAARDIGYEYVAITDHSESSMASRSLAGDDLLYQAEEIENVRARVPGIAILHGVEVDILADGRLDFPDEALAPLDIVLASLHHAAGQSGTELTERYLAAIRHPMVSALTHLTNRLVGRREGYDLDVDRIFEAAAATGTALEVDGAPVHLDMDGGLARRAIAAGVTLTVDSDGHRTDALRRNMALAVGTARRGWVEPRHVLNCRPLVEVRAFLAAKRR